MRVEGLYTISACNDGEGAAFDVAVDPSHPIFEGHFPDMPVLPGVCTMHIVKSCASLIAKRPLRYEAVAEVKFLSLIVPPVNPLLKVRLELGEPDEDGRHPLRAEVLTRDEVVFKIKSTVAGEI